MTTQLSDSVTYQGQDYRLLAGSEGAPFTPSAYGYRPAMASTACYRGYVSAYQVLDDALVLNAFQVNHQAAGVPASPNHRPPPLNGVHAELASMSLAGQWLFREVRLPLDYSGGLVIVRGWIDSVVGYLGHPACHYEEVHELVFENGRLTSAQDLSSAIGRIRESLRSRLTSSDRPSPDELEGWIKTCFRCAYLRNGST